MDYVASNGTRDVNSTHVSDEYRRTPQANSVTRDYDKRKLQTGVRPDSAISVHLRSRLLRRLDLFLDMIFAFTERLYLLII